MDKVELAEQLHDQGFNCAQSVLGAFSEAYGLNQSTALKLASNMGGGMGCGGTCGALTAALLVAGLRYGSDLPANADARHRCSQQSAEITKRFREETGATTCPGVIGVDVMTTEGRTKALQDNLFGTICADAIETAAEILDDMGY